MTRTVFTDRRDGGRILAPLLAEQTAGTDPIVLALPRGGVPVAYEVAAGLGAPIDVFLVRKLGVPGHEELALGAIASGGVRALNDDVVEAVRVTPDVIDRISRIAGEELARRELAYREGRSPLAVEGRTVVLVDDGVATGSSMRAAVEAVRGRRPRRVVVAAPTGSIRGCEALRAVADDVVCASMPDPFVAVALSYRDFGQTSDDEVRSLLSAARRGGPAPHRGP